MKIQLLNSFTYSNIFIKYFWIFQANFTKKIFSKHLEMLVNLNYSSPKSLRIKMHLSLKPIVNNHNNNNFQLFLVHFRYVWQREQHLDLSLDCLWEMIYERHIQLLVCSSHSVRFCRTFCTKNVSKFFSIRWFIKYAHFLLPTYFVPKLMNMLNSVLQLDCQKKPQTYLT